MGFYDARHDGAPDITIFKSKRVRARKDYLCDHCHMPIHSGDEYQNTAGTEDGKFFVQRTHLPQCPTEQTPCRSCGATGSVLIEEDDRTKTREHPCPHCHGYGYFDPPAQRPQPNPAV